MVALSFLHHASTPFSLLQVHVLTVRASDRGSPPLWSEATLTVHLIDVNENAHAPVFADLVQTAAVKEDSPAGTLVTSVKASDADAPGDDSRVTYSIRGGDGQGYFSVDEKGESFSSSFPDLKPKQHPISACFWSIARWKGTSLAVRVPKAAKGSRGSRGDDN